MEIKEVEVTARRKLWNVLRGRGRPAVKTNKNNGVFFS